MVGTASVEVLRRYSAGASGGVWARGVPTLLVHATNDTTIDVNDSRAYVVAARIAGDDATFIEAISGGHKRLLDPGSKAWESAAQWLTTVATTST